MMHHLCRRYPDGVGDTAKAVEKAGAIDREPQWHGVCRAARRGKKRV